MKESFNHTEEVIRFAESLDQIFQNLRLPQTRYLGGGYSASFVPKDSQGEPLDKIRQRVILRKVVNDHVSREVDSEFGFSLPPGFQVPYFTFYILNLDGNAVTSPYGVFPNEFVVDKDLRLFEIKNSFILDKGGRRIKRESIVKLKNTWEETRDELVELQNIDKYDLTSVVQATSVLQSQQRFVPWLATDYEKIGFHIARIEKGDFVYKKD